MANTSAAFGLQAIGTTDGGDYRGKMMEVEFLAADSTACFLNDPITFTGTTGADGKTPVVTQSSAGGAFGGVIDSFVPNFEDEGTLSSTPNHRAASTSRKALISHGKDVLYIVKEDAVGGSLSAASAGLNADLVIGTGSSVTGASGAMLDSSGAASGTAQLRIHRLSPEIHVLLGSAANGTQADWVVSINENQADHGSGF